MFRIPGYEQGANITIVDAIYHKSRKDPETGKYGKDSIDIIYRDLDTNEKKLYHLVEPEYTFYIANEDVIIDYNMMCIERDKVHPVTCKYRDVLKTIAEQTDNLNFFYDNIRDGNYRNNDQLYLLPRVFNADMHIEDWYRWQFARTYKNEAYNPTKIFFDIEVDTVDINYQFPEPGQCPINAVTMIDDTNKQIYTLLLENHKNPFVEKFKNTPNLTQELKAFVQSRVGGWKNEKRFGLDEFNYNILFYDIEIELIRDMFRYINTVKSDFALAWNIAFDLPYIINRIMVLGYDPVSIICHPDFEVKECLYIVDHRADKFEERTDYAHISSYTVYLDQLILFASRRKGQKKGEITSYKLDFIGEVVAHVRKLDYHHITPILGKLPELDYYTFVFYNVMDTIVQLCIDRKVEDVSFVFAKALQVNTRYAKIHRQTTYLVNRGINDFFEMGYVMGNNVNKHNQKIEFPGAFVADPKLLGPKSRKKINGKPIGIVEGAIDWDYTALYPSEIDESNMAPNTMYGKIILPEQLDYKENRFNNEYFDRTVYFCEDLVSHNRLDFCQRYLHLASYEEMYFDIIKYFTEVVSPYGRLYYRDTVTGKQTMCYVTKRDKREMCRVVDTKRTMCHIADRMPKWEGNNEFN